MQPPEGWVGDSFTIDYTITNYLVEPTTGVLTCDITQGQGDSIAGTGFKMGAVNVAPLQPGQSASGTIVIKHWKATQAFVQPGVHSLWMQYWVEDPTARALGLSSGAAGSRR